jgi:hypothetical protein
MDVASEMRELIVRTAKGLPFGDRRRQYSADTVDRLRLSKRQAQQLFGGGRVTIRKAQHERRTGVTCRDAFGCRGRKPSELFFTDAKVSSDFMVDCLEQWLAERAGSLTAIRKLVLDLDNGPENSGQRSQWLWRLLRLAQQYQWVIVLAHYPP